VGNQIGRHTQRKDVYISAPIFAWSLHKSAGFDVNSSPQTLIVLENNAEKFQGWENSFQSWAKLLKIFGEVQHAQ